MADRTVNARLTLDIKQYLMSLATASKATREFARELEEASGRAAKSKGDKLGRDLGEGVAAGVKTGAERAGRAAERASEKVGEKAGEAASRGYRRGLNRRGSLGMPNISVGSGGVRLGGAGFAVLTAGAMAAEAAVSALPPAIMAVGGALAAIPSLAAGATAAIGSIGLGLVGVGGAIGDVFSPPAGGGGGGGGLDQTAARERRLAAAQREARRAQEDVTRARMEATRELRDMSIQLARLRLDEEAATRDLADAERELAVAKVAGRDPQQDVRDAEIAVLEARQNLRDVQRTRGHTEVEVARAQQQIVEAEQALAEAITRASMPDDAVGDADLRVREAKQSLLEIRTELGDYIVDTRAAQRAGVEGSERVRDALERQQDALDNLASAQESFASAAAGGAAKAATAYDKLSPNAKRFVDTIAKLKPELLGVQQLAQDRIFAGLDRELMDLSHVWLPVAQRQVKVFGDNWNTTFKNAAKAARDPQFVGAVEGALKPWDRFMDGFNARIDDSFTSIQHLLTASTPFVDRFNDRLLEGVDDFNEWIERAEKSGELDHFFERAADSAEDLMDITIDLARIMVQVIDKTSEGNDTLDRMADRLSDLADSGEGADRIVSALDTVDKILDAIMETTEPLREAISTMLSDPETMDAAKDIATVLQIIFETVNSLVGVFSSLPGGLREAILVIGGLALAYGALGRRLDGLRGKFQPAIDGAGRLNDRLRNTGPAGTIAAKGLDRAGRAAGIAAKGFLAIQAAGVIVGALMGSDVNPQMDAATLGLERWNKGAKLGGEAARIFGEDSEKLGYAMGRLATDGFEEGADKIVEALIPGLSNMDTSMAKSTELTKIFDSTLAGLVKSGQKAKAEEFLADFAAKHNIPIERARELLPEYAAATEVAAEKTGELGVVIHDTIGAYREWRDMQLEAIDAEFAWMDAADDMKDQFEEIKERGWDENTRSGRENIRMLIENAQKAVELRDKRLLEGDAVDEVNAQYYNNLRLIRDNAKATGANTEMVDKYIKKVHTVPPVKRTRIEVAIDVFANLKWGFGTSGLFKSLASGLAGLQLSVGLFEPKKKRWGGVTERARYGTLRDAGVYSGGPLYEFAEPETGGEAFVPRLGDRRRSLDVLGTAAGWYGMQLSPAAGYGRPARAWSEDYGRPAAARAQSSGLMPPPQAYADAVASRVAPLLAAAASVQVMPVTDAEGLALMVRKGEQDAARRG